MSFFSLFLVVLALQLVGFVYSTVFRRDTLTDLLYGGSFVLVSVLFFVFSDALGWQEGLVYSVVIIRGVRLAGYLFARILAMGKDRRFDSMRNQRRSMLGFWSLQTITIMIVLLPVWFVFSGDIQYGNIFSILGFVISIGGIILETVADQQKFTYKKKHPNKRVNIGVWKYARHPNYLGEMMMWRGVFLMSVPFFQGWGWLGIISPLFITVMLLYVSGVPLLEKQWEKKYGDDPAYQHYKKNSRLLLPVTLCRNRDS